MPQVENIYRIMKKKVLLVQLFTAVLMVLQLYLQYSHLRRDPADYLSSRYYIFSLPLWVLLFLGRRP